MNKKEIISYLQDVIELEKQLMVCETIKEKYTQKADAMTLPESYETVYPKAAKATSAYDFREIPKEWHDSDKRIKDAFAQYESKKKIDRFLSKAFLKKTWVGVIIILIIYFINGINVMEEYPLVITIFGAPFVGIIAWLLLGRLGFILQEINGAGRAEKRYISLCKEVFPKCWEKEEEKRASEKEQKADEYIEKMDDVLIPIEYETRALLDILYSQGIIESEYRELLALVQIQEYLRFNCETLDGVGGAYHFFEKELCKGTICSDIDKFIAEVNASGGYKYRNSMSQMCDHVKEMNDLVKMDLSVDSEKFRSCMNLYDSVNKKLREKYAI